MYYFACDNHLYMISWLPFFGLVKFETDVKILKAQVYHIAYCKSQLYFDLSVYKSIRSVLKRMWSWFALRMSRHAALWSDAKTDEDPLGLQRAFRLGSLTNFQVASFVIKYHYKKAERNNELLIEFVLLEMFL